MPPRVFLTVALAMMTAGVSTASDDPPAPVTQDVESGVRPAADPFRIGGELKAGYRWSQTQQSAILDRNAIPVGFMKTPDAGSAVELQHLAISGAGEVTPGVHARFEIRFMDQYNRNPTSTDARVFVRQAYLRFGAKAEPLQRDVEERFFTLVGMAPRFSKQMTRHFESYGLVGTAVGRFEQPQVQIGGTIGRRVYFRAMLGSGNPLFLRDTNALAGDELSTATSDPRAVYGTGFPIFYDAKFTETGVTGSLETGIGLGARFADDAGNGIDVLAWRFGRRLAQTARLPGTDYPAELAVFAGAGAPITSRGDRRREWGMNVEAKYRGARVFAQGVDQDLAGVRRRGLETEVSVTIPLNGLFLVGESPFGNWIQPSFRYSKTFNRFAAPVSFPRISTHWPWSKYDFGLRFGLVRDADLTVEYTIHRVFRTATLPNLPMGELLATVRVGF